MAATSGNWDGKKLQITAHAVVEIAQVDTIYERNEFELTDESGRINLLSAEKSRGRKTGRCTRGSARRSRPRRSNPPRKRPATR